MRSFTLIISLFLGVTVNSVTYTNHEKGCKVDFPCQYEADTLSNDYPNLKVNTIRLSADEPVVTTLIKFHIIYRFICAQFYPIPKNVNSADLMKAMKFYSKKMNEDSFFAMNETILEQKQTTFRNLPSTDYKLEMKDKGLVEYRKVIFKKDKIYALSYMCLKSFFDNDRMNTFFNSLDIQ